MTAESAEEHVVIPGSIGQDGGIENFAAASAFPCIKGAYEIIELLSKHAAFTFWTIHGDTP
jgi:hypothetical protein